MANESELYSEESHSVTVTICNRIDDIQYVCRRGSAQRDRDGETTSQRFFEGPIFQEKPPPVLFESATAILNAARIAFSNAESPTNSYLTATLTCRTYQVGQRADALSTGYEESAEIEAEWPLLSGKTARWERARGSISGLVRELQSETGLACQVRSSLAQQTYWPAPRCSLPILWSARSIAKLQMLFLRAFEGDRVIRNLSFLTAGDLPEMAFTLEDRPEKAGEDVDHEGNPRRTIVLLREGRPTALACNKSIAKQLEVSSTGHARRQSFDSASTIGFWHPHLQGKSCSDSLLSDMEKGLSVRDFETLYFDSSSGEMTLALEASLIHHGQEGERLEVIPLETTLPEIMASLEVFENSKITTGFAVGKHSQRLFTELTTSRARSRPIAISGSVPPNHYW